MTVVSSVNIQEKKIESVVKIEQSDEKKHAYKKLDKSGKFKPIIMGVWMRSTNSYRVLILGIS